MSAISPPECQGRLWCWRPCRWAYVLVAPYLGFSVGLDVRPPRVTLYAGWMEICVGKWWG